MHSIRYRRLLAPVPALALIGAILAPPGFAQTQAASAYTTDLGGVCPNPIVIQTNWWPEPDHGAIYQLIGPGGTEDTNRNAYVGPLGSTGVNLEIRAGGPAIGFQPATAQEYSDDSILLGMVGTDESIQNSADQPTIAVFATYERNPLIFFWGNADWGFQSVADIGKSGATVLAFGSATYLDVLEGKGELDKNQVDTSYTGDPSRFVAADGNIVSEGFVTSEPFRYENEVEGWKQPVKYLLVDSELPIYQDALAIRADKLDGARACLQKLVPLLQQAEIDYLHDPTATNGVITEFASKLKGGAQTSVPGAVAAVQVMQSAGIVGNGTDGVFGSFDPARTRTLIDAYAPIFASKGKPIKEGLQPSEVQTNEFLNPTLKL